MAEDSSSTKLKDKVKNIFRRKSSSGEPSMLLNAAILAALPRWQVLCSRTSTVCSLRSLLRSSVALVALWRSQLKCYCCSAMQRFMCKLGLWLGFPLVGVAN